MSDLLEYIVKNIIDAGTEVRVKESQTPEGLLNLELSVPKDQIGKVIGKEGKIIKSIRNLIKLLAIKRNVRVNVILMED